MSFSQRKLLEVKNHFGDIPDRFERYLYSNGIHKSFEKLPSFQILQYFRNYFTTFPFSFFSKQISWQKKYFLIPLANSCDIDNQKNIVKMVFTSSNRRKRNQHNIFLHTHSILFKTNFIIFHAVLLDKFGEGITFDQMISLMWQP